MVHYYNIKFPLKAMASAVNSNQTNTENGKYENTNGFDARYGLKKISCCCCCVCVCMLCSTVVIYVVMRRVSIDDIGA